MRWGETWPVELQGRLLCKGGAGAAAAAACHELIMLCRFHKSPPELVHADRSRTGRRLLVR